jgi:N,N'-diacetyllegionaminate synthase
MDSRLMDRREIRIGERKVGTGNPAYLVAEIGINHNGDMDLARRTIDAAKRAGADAVKFQTYKTEEFIPDRSLTWTQTVDGREEVISQYDMFKAAELSLRQLEILAHHCREAGIDWHATPMDIEGVADLVKLGCHVIKNGSDCLGHIPLIKAMSQTGLPTVVSTGMATLADVEEAVAAFGPGNTERLILLLCTSQYPSPLEEVNLRRIATLASAFGCLSGFSDHTEGHAVAVGAAALGACWIEKHFTFDKSLPGPDHRFSADPQEFSALVSGVRAVEKSLGSPAFAISKAENEARSLHRLSCVAQRNLPAGHVLREEDITYMRPGTGLPPRDVGKLIGRRLAKPAERGSLLMETELA